MAYIDIAVILYPNDYSKVYSHARAHCMYLYLCSYNKHRHICIKYVTKLFRLVLLPCYRTVKSGTFSKRSGAATKGFEPCEFWFPVAFLILNTALYFLG